MTVCLILNDVRKARLAAAGVTPVVPDGVAFLPGEFVVFDGALDIPLRVAARWVIIPKPPETQPRCYNVLEETEKRFLSPG